MYDHGMIGRKYAGKIKQFITGSVGFDDFEWGRNIVLRRRITIQKLYTKCALMKQQHDTVNSVVSL